MLATVLVVTGAVMFIVGIDMIAGLGVALAVAGALLMGAAYGLHRAAAAAGAAQRVVEAPSLGRVA